MKYILLLTLLGLFSNCTQKLTVVEVGKFGVVGNGIIDDTRAIQNAINAADRIIHLEPKTYLISSALKLKSGLTIEGHGATIVLAKSTPINAIEISNKRNVNVYNLNVVGQKEDVVDKNSTGRNRNLINITNSVNVELDSLSFSNHNYTTVFISDVTNLSIRNSTFSNIGSRTSAKEFPYYSYDGIFIGGYARTENVIIENCTFSNIGSFLKESIPANDGDAIQIQTAKEGNVYNVQIRSCSFNRCSARAMKIQNGSKFVISDNKFTDCGKGVGMTMINDISDVEIVNNEFTDVGYVVATNHKNDASDILISDNVVNRCNFFFRGSGGSTISFSTIENNIVSDVGYCFIDAKVMNLDVLNNTINGYAGKNDKSYHMAILIGGYSKNINILNNKIKVLKETRTAIYLQTNIKNIEIEDNELYLFKNENEDRIIVNHSKNDQKYNKNLVKRSN